MTAASDLLVALADPHRADAQLKEQLAGPIEWDDVRALAHDLGMRGLPYARLETFQSEIPSDDLEGMRTEYFDAATRTANLLTGLTEVLTSLDEQGIAVIVLKGAFLAENVYGNIALRSMSDVDLLVRETDMDATHALLQAIGFKADESFQSETAYATHHHGPPMISPSRNMNLEIHRHIVPSDTPVSIDTDELWARSRRATVASRPVLTLAPSDLVIHLCVHLAWCDRFLSSLRTCADIIRTIDRFQEELDPASFSARVRQLRSESVVYPALHAANEIFAIRDGASADLAKTVDRRSPLLQRIARAVLTRGPASSYAVPDWVVSGTVGPFLIPGGPITTTARLLRAWWSMLTSRHPTGHRPNPLAPVKRGLQRAFRRPRSR